MSFTVLAMYLMQELDGAKKDEKRRVVQPRVEINVNTQEPDESLFFAEMPSATKLECICRICQNDGVIAIFDKSGNRDIAMDIESCANVKIENDDGLPSHICAECLDLLDVALLFKSKCEEMDSHLRATLSKKEKVRVKKQYLQVQPELSEMEQNEKHIGANKKKCVTDQSITVNKEDFYMQDDCLIIEPSHIDGNYKHVEEHYVKTEQAYVEENHMHIEDDAIMDIGDKYAKSEQAAIEQNAIHVEDAEMEKAGLNENDKHKQIDHTEIDKVSIKEDKLLIRATRLETNLAEIEEKDAFFQNMQRAKMEEQKVMLQLKIENIKQGRIKKRAYLRAKFSKIEQDKTKGQESLLQTEFEKIKEDEIEEQLSEKKSEDDYAADISPPRMLEEDTFHDDCSSEEKNRSKKPGDSNINKYDDRRNIRDGFVDCDKCYRCFFDRKEYKMHLPTCESDKKLRLNRRRIREKSPWLCHICGKTLRNRATYNAHRVTHSDKLPFACDKCPYRGRTLEVFRIHSRVHTGYRPYKCPICSRGFVNSSNRDKHILVHDTNRPFKCQECRKVFRTELLMTNHINVMHHGANLVECDICGALLTSKSGLLGHRRKIHKLRSSGRATYLQLLAKEQGNDSTKTEEIAEIQPNDTYRSEDC